MKKQFSLATILVGLAVLLSFTGCASPPANTNANVAVATPEPTPDRLAIQTELTRIENDWPRIIKEKDGATVRRIEADDVTIVYPDGSTGNKEQDAKDIEAGLFSFESWDTLEVKVNIVNNDLAIVTLRYNVKNAVVKSTDGRSRDISGQYLSLDTFARRNGQWQFIALSSVKVDPAVAKALPTPGASPTPTPIPRPSLAATPRSSPVTRPSPAAPRPTTTAPRPTPARTAPTPARTP